MSKLITENDLKGILDEVFPSNSIPSAETLGTGVMLIRINDIRILQLNHATGSTISNITISADDRPLSDDARGSGVRRTSSLTGVYDGMCVVRYTSGVISAYYGATYGASLSTLGNTDVFIGTVIWTV